MASFGGRAVIPCTSIHRRLMIFRPSSSRPSLYSPIMRYSHHDPVDERAPSTAEEFKRVAEEKLREAEQGVASQTVKKTYDGTEEAVSADPNVESLRKRYKEHEGNVDRHWTSNEEGPPNTGSGGS